MVDTLISLREDFGEHAVVPDRRHRCVPGTAHLASLAGFDRTGPYRGDAAPRRVAAPAAGSEEFVAPRVIHDALALRQQPAGGILFQPVTQLDISATQIRALLARGQSPRYLLPDAVLDCIHDRALYRPLPCSNSCYRVRR